MDVVGRRVHSRAASTRGGRGKAVIGVVACAALIATVLISACAGDQPQSGVSMAPPGSVNIYRDTWGVPHIFGVTDADCAYGLAYAHAEDDYPTIQEALLAIRARVATVQGEEGAPVDFMLVDIWDVALPALQLVSPTQVPSPSQWSSVEQASPSLQRVALDAGDQARCARVGTHSSQGLSGLAVPAP